MKKIISLTLIISLLVATIPFSSIAETETSYVIDFDIDNLGELEQEYREWWLKHIADPYNEYLELGDYFDDTINAWHGWGGLIDITVRGMRPTIIFEAATLGYTQMLKDFRDLDMDFGVNTVENYWLVSQNEGQLRRTALINIAIAMMEEEKAGNLVLKNDLSNVSGIAKTNQQISERETKAQFYLELAKVITLTFKEGFQVYKVHNPGSVIADKGDKIAEWVSQGIDIATEVLDEYMKENAIYDNLMAAVDQYADTLNAACDAYVECLEKTYNDYSTGQYESYVHEYINAFKSVKDNQNKLHEIALEEILKGTGYTKEAIEQMQSEYMNVLSADLLVSIFVLACNQTIQNVFGIDEDVKIIKYTNDPGKLRLPADEDDPDFITSLKDHITLDLPSLANAVLEKPAQKIFDMSAQKQLKDTIRSNLTGTTKTPAKEAWEKINAPREQQVTAAQKALSMVFDAWELGVSIRELMQVTTRQNNLDNNKGVFDTYGLNLVLSMKLRLEAFCEGGLTTNGKVDWKSAVYTISIDQLEKYRVALATIANYDISILINYRNMRVINDSNGFKFKYGIDWLTTGKIDERIQTVMTYRDRFVTRPTKFDILF